MLEGTKLLSSTDSIYDKTIKDFLDDRKIIINGEINSQILEDVTMHILRFNKEDKHIPINERKKIFLYISSPGGEVISGNNLISVIKTSKTPIVGVVFAMAASMAASILLVCKERIAWENSVILIHDGQKDVRSSSNKAKDTMRFYDKLDAIRKELIISHSSITSEEYDETIDREQYFLANEAKSKGIIDKIIGLDIDIDEFL